MALNKLVYNTEMLDNIKKSLGELNKFKTQVGIFENKDSRKKNFEGLGNADIAARMEFGGEFNWPWWYTVTGRHRIGIPARSFLRMPIRTHISDIQKLVQKDVMALFAKNKVDLLFKRLGIACRKIIDQAFQTSGWGEWAPNHPLVIERKGSDKPLIDTGSLRRSISSRVDKK